MPSVLFSDSLARKQAMNPWTKLLLALPIVYGLIFVVSRLVIGYWIPEHQITDVPFTGESAAIFTVAFFVFFTPLLYLFGCAVAGAWLKPEWPRLALYMGATFMGGALGEILIGNLGEMALGRMVWRYQIWPEHGGYTTGVGAVMWPMYGFYLYCFHEALRKRGSKHIDNVLYSGVLIAIDAMVLETLANIFSLATFGTYYFYYVAGDLLHFTSAEIFLPYVAFGVFGSCLLKLLDRPTFPLVWWGVALYLAGIWLVFLL